MTFTVVLTGGICSGKSSVSRLFSELGIEIIDADLISRKVVQPKARGWMAIQAEFGNLYFDENQTLDRKKLREAIFKHKQIKNSLENILHPIIRDEISQCMKQATGSYVILDIPLFTENPQHYPADRVLVVDVAESIQLERLMQRDHCSQEQACSIIQQQASRTSRNALADEIIDNSGTLEQLTTKVHKLHQNFLRRAKS